MFLVLVQVRSAASPQQPTFKIHSGQETILLEGIPPGSTGSAVLTRTQHLQYKYRLLVFICANFRVTTKFIRDGLFVWVKTLG